MERRFSMVWYWKRLGGHVHVRVFSGMVSTELSDEDLIGQRGRSGTLIFREDEWESAMSMFESFGGWPMTIVREENEGAD